MRAKGDITSANIFETILADEEHHIDYLDTQLELVEKLGEALYIAQLIEQEAPPRAEPSDGRSGRQRGPRPVRRLRGSGFARPRRPGRAGIGAALRCGSSSRRGQAPRPRSAWMRRTHEPQSVPALQAEAIWRGVQARPPRARLTCCSVTPKQEQTYTRFTSRGIVSVAVPADR